MLWFEVFTSLVKAFSGCRGQRSLLGVIFLLLLHEFNCISICFGKSGSYRWLRASRNHFTGTNNSLQGGQVQIAKRSRLCNDDPQRLISVNFEILLFCLAQQPYLLLASVITEPNWYIRCKQLTEWTHYDIKPNLNWHSLPIVLGASRPYKVIICKSCVELPLSVQSTTWTVGPA